jgi:hypothetical protein
MRVMLWTRARRGAGLMACTSLLGGCANMQYTLDDGRRVDETLLANIRIYGKASQALRPAIVRSAALDAVACETEWELPFDFATSDGLTTPERVAWVRTLKVDERLTVIAVAPAAALGVGDKIVDIEGYRSDSGRKMSEVLAERRDEGRSFQVTTSGGRKLRVEPVRVCRGRAMIAAPGKPAAQDYHWSYSIHPLEIFRQDLTADEALWLVLWTQGLSAEGGARMKAYQYGFVPASVVVGIASLLSGVGAVAQAAQAGGATAAASQAGLFVAKTAVTGVALDIAQQQSASMMEASSRNRANLKGVAWVGGTVFDEADRWSFARMPKLGGDPLAAVTLHQKLIQAGSADNAFVLDAARLPRLQAAAEEARLGPRMVRLLNGEESPAAKKKADDTIAELTVEAMPQASKALTARTAGDLPLPPLAMESAMPAQSRTEAQ